MNNPQNNDQKGAPQKDQKPANEVTKTPDDAAKVDPAKKTDDAKKEGDKSEEAPAAPEKRAN